MARTSKKRAGKISGRITPAPGWENLLTSLPRNSTSDVRASFADALDRSRTGERRIFNRYGKEVAALVPLKDAALLLLLEKPKHRKVRRALLAELDALKP